MVKQLYCILFILIIFLIFKIIYYKYNMYSKLYILSDKYSPPFKKYKIKPNDKFIIFNYDGGGFNNIRISFEVIIIMAKLLNRVLVIPPKKEFYLLNGQSTCIFDFYSRKNLSNYINICDYNDISNNIKEVNDLFSFAKKTKNYYFFVNNNDRNKCVYYKNNKLLVYKDNKYIDLKQINKKYLCLFSSFNKKEVQKVLNYKGKIENVRFLNNYDFFFRMDLKDRQKILYKFIFDSIKINGNIIKSVIKIYNYYNLNDYNATHIRSNDFQQFNNLQKLKINDITDLIKKNFNNSKRLFIITDHHTIEDITNHFSNYKIITNKDIYKKFTIEHKYHGLVESLLCVLANEFIGSEMSTFTFYIQILRGYMSKYYDHINDNLMYTTTINPKINYNEFINYQNIKPNKSQKCIVWDRISNNVWKFI